MTKKKPTKNDFAKEFEELEEIVEWFESSDVDLEDGLKKFERGLELAQRCRSQLKDLENKVTEIKEKFSDFDASEDTSVDDGEDVEDEEQGTLL